ncbi:MAG: hypothetical protein AAFY47_11120, partial [Pseudomonadota bacterium]
MSINIGMAASDELRPRITVIGIGGAGGNAIANMIAAEIDGVEFIVANTDAQALSSSPTEKRIQLGPDITNGLGAGARPEVGKAAAEETVAEIEAALDVHRRADDAVASLDFEALDILYQETSERHPRRAELRSAIRRAIVSDACAQMLRYRTICPPQVMALAQGAPTEVAVAADPPPEPAPAATTEPEPVDPTAVFIEDADDESLAKSAAVKVEWR